MNKFLKEHVGKLISLCIGTIAAAFIAIAEKLLPIDELRNGDAMVYVKLIMALLTITIMLCFYTIILKKRFAKKINLKNYDFVEDPGFYRHKSNSGHYCNPCLSKGIESQLSIHHEDGLKCRVCDEVYIGPKSDLAAFVEYSKRD